MKCDKAGKAAELAKREIFQPRKPKTSEENELIIHIVNCQPCKEAYMRETSCLNNTKPGRKTRVTGRI